MFTVILRIYSVLAIAICITIFGTTNSFGAIPLCGEVLAFNTSIDPSVPSHLLLRKEWRSYRASAEPGTKPSMDMSAKDYAFGRKISFTHQNWESLAQTIEPERGAMAAVAGPLDASQRAYMRRNYRGGQAASFSERAKRKTELEEILAYEAGAWRHANEIYETYGKQRWMNTMLDIFRERSERTVQFLIAEGVMIEVSNGENLILSARILPEGTHVLNRRAAQLQRDYDGLALHYESSVSARGGFQGLTNELNLSEAELLTLKVKSPTIGHELRHARNDNDGTRDFGSASAKGDEQLPGNPFAYHKYQSYEEAEAHSYSLRAEAQELLKKYQSGDLEGIQHFELALINLAFQATIVTERNSIVTNLVEGALGRGVEPRFEYKSHRLGRSSKYEARIPLSYDGKNFEYIMTIHDATLKTKEERIQYIRSKVTYMLRLNPNYRTQFDVALQAAEKLTTAQSLREKAAILEGIISVTRPHFWEEGNFVVVTKADLVQKFNLVVSDRWNRFSNLQ